MNPTSVSIPCALGRLASPSPASSDELRAMRNKKSKEIGGLMAKGQKEEAEKIKAEVKAMADEMTKLEEDEKTFAEEVKNRMMVIPNIIDPSVPIGKDDSENVEIERGGRIAASARVAKPSSSTTGASAASSSSICSRSFGAGMPVSSS